LSALLFYLYNEYLSKEFLEDFEDLKMGGQVIRTVKYSDKFLLLAEEEVVLLNEIGRYYGMKKNVEKN
jgi:predicted nucleotidyltransferase